jgi:hypothetical protein
LRLHLPNTLLGRVTVQEPIPHTTLDTPKYNATTGIRRCETMWDRPDILRLITVFAASALGVSVVLAIFLVSLMYTNDTEAKLAIALAGTAIAMIGTLVGFVAGQAQGAAGKEKAESRAEVATDRAATAERRLTAVQAQAPEAVEKAKAAFAEWWE